MDKREREIFSMETLIELYDERAIENVIGPETFLPERIIYLCPEEVANDKKMQKVYERFFAKRGLDVEIQFVKSNIYKSDKILRQLEYIYQQYPNCVLDVTGGNDAMLFAAGMFCNKTGVPTFTYSRKKNQFYEISNAHFADARPCILEYSVEDFFLMAGGTLRAGRVDNHILGKYMDTFEPFFQIFMKHRKHWVNEVTFFTRISQGHRDEAVSLKVSGNLEQKGEHGKRVHGDVSLLQDLEKIGYISELKMEDDNYVRFEFRDEQIRTWLRDIGSVLELYMYKMCMDTGIFQDVVSSAIVDWDGTRGHDSVSNEIDVVATRGTVPLFISCKACYIKTEALNELAILRDRFGGKGAKAAIVTTEYCNAAARHRAAQLGITVIDLEELKTGDIVERLKVIMKYKRD